MSQYVIQKRMVRSQGCGEDRKQWLDNSEFKGVGKEK
jgi:hypothetical protein